MTFRRSTCSTSSSAASSRRMPARAPTITERGDVLGRQRRPDARPPATVSRARSTTRTSSVCSRPSPKAPFRTSASWRAATTSATSTTTRLVTRRSTSPTSARPRCRPTTCYFATEIRFDNVLIGDYQQVNSANNFAQGNPMVHIRAIPEGGDPARSGPDHQLRPHVLQPLSRLVALPIVVSRFRRSSPRAGSRAARRDFQTFYKIWREGDTANGDRTCATWDDNVTNVAEIVRFDEAENRSRRCPGVAHFAADHHRVHAA